MKIRRIAVAAFGKHQDLTLDGLDQAPMVVFLGANEAGKSTLFRLLRTLFYGFLPANRDQNPDVPWDGRSAEIAATLIDGLGPVEVERRLRSRPTGRWRRGDHLEDLVNRPLPIVGELTPRLFDALYALRLEDLCPLDRQVLGNLHDRVFASSGRGALQPVGEVVAGIEKERKELARPDQRGKPRAKLLHEEIRVAKERRERVRQEETRKRELLQERQQLEVRRSQWESQAKRWELVLRWAPTHRVVRERELLIEERKRWIVSPIPPDLPDHPAAALKDLRQQSRMSLHSCQEREARLAEWRLCQRALEPEEWERGRTLTRFRETLGRAALHHESGHSQRRLEDCVEELGSSFAALTGAEWTPEVQDFVARFDSRVAGDLARRFQESRQEREASPSLPSTKGVAVCTALLAGFGALALLASGVVGSLLIAGASLVLGGGSVVAWRVLRQRQNANAEEHARLDEMRKREQELTARWSEMLGALAEYFPHPALSAAQSLERWHRLDEQRRAAEKMLSEHLREEQALLQRWADFDGVPAKSLGEARDRAERRWADLQGRQATAKSVREKIPAEETLLAEDRDQARRWQERIGRLLETIQATTGLTGEDEREACQRIQSAREHSLRIDQIDQSLAELRDAQGALPADLEGLLADPDFDSSAKATAHAGAERRRLEEHLEAAHRRLGEIAAELDRPGETLEALDSFLSEKTQELSEVLGRHDQLLALESLMRAADRRFREANQSAVLDTASQSLSRLTGDRYDTISVDEQGALYVSGKAVSNRSQPADRDLSRGTREQVQLALRLAFLRRLDEERGESLPVILDEALVNFDPARLDRTLELLQACAEDTQFFLFTCQPWVAEQARARVGAKVVALRRDEDLRLPKAAGESA